MQIQAQRVDAMGLALTEHLVDTYEAYAESSHREDGENIQGQQAARHDPCSAAPGSLFSTTAERYGVYG